MTRPHAHLCRRHDSITSPAEVWEVSRVEAKAHWPGIWQDAILNLELHLVESGKVVATRWPNMMVRENSNEKVLRL